MKAALLLLAVLCSACASDGPTAPSSSTPPVVPTPAPTPVPVPTSYTVSGTVTATNGGQALSGLSLDLNGQATSTNGAGGFTYTLTSGFTSRLTLTGATIVPRALTLNVGSARTVAVQAIGLAGFDLGFYRQLVRNRYDAPAMFEPLRRWTRTPQIYLKTVDEAGEAIHGPTLDLIEATAKDAVPRWTSGVLGVPSVTRGTETRVGVSGWITIRFPATEEATYCGQAQVGTDGGWIELSYHQPTSAAASCRVAGAVVAPRTVRHELGHALGFWHTDGPSDLMRGGTWTSAEANLQPSTRELAAATIAYARPVGNVDPDSDPTSSVSLAPRTVR